MTVSKTQRIGAKNSRTAQICPYILTVYQHIRKRCVIYKRLAWMSVVIIILLKGFARTLVRDVGIQQHPCLFCIRPVIKIPIITLNHTPTIRHTKDWMHVVPHQQNIYHPLLWNTLKRSIMSKWININEAAVKYRYNKAIIQLWAEMKRFPISYEEDTPAIDEKSFQEFIDKCKRGITAEYIDTLEELCISKTRICDIYVEIIGRHVKYKHTRKGVSKAGFHQNPQL